MVNFFYIRHGETLFNVVGKSQGWCDSPLTEKGISQAEKAGELLQEININKVYSSSSERAIDTATIVLADKDIKIKPLKGLKEMSFGTLEASELGADNDMARCWKKKDFKEYGGEDKQMFINRIRETFKQIISESNDEDNILIVSHNGYFYYS